MFNIIKLNAKDNIAVAPMNIPLGSKINSDLNAENEIPFGHKISLNNIKKGELIYKYAKNYTDWNCGHMAVHYACNKLLANEVHMYGFDSIFDFNFS